MNLTIAMRIRFLTILAALTLGAVGWIGYNGTKELQRAIQTINTETIPRATTIDDIKSYTFLTSVQSLRHFIVVESYRKEAFDKEINANRALIEKRFSEYEKLAADEKDKQLLAQDRKDYAAYLVVLDKLLDFSRKNDNYSIRSLLDKEFDAAAEKLRKSLETHQQYARQQAADTSKASEIAAQQATTRSAVTILAGIFAIMFIGFFIRRSIISGLTAVKSTVARVEHELDFSLRIPSKGKDELGEMAVALNRLLERLQDNLKAIAQSAAKVAHASGDMAETSGQVARASEMQSNSAANMAASVQELTVSIAHVGDRASDTRHSSADAGVLAKNGRAVVEKTVADINAIADAVQQASLRIRELGAQSDKISSVVAVIRDVADQTNLLALNAAIEAARAGEQGRGFAVVADEVRKLAERTAKSTQEITAMVEAVRNGAKSAEDGMELAVERVSAGVARTGEISQAIHQISKSSEQTVAMVTDISDAISEQASASTSLAQHVEKIAQMAEQCSAAASGSADSAQELDTLASEMRKIVSAYKL